MHRKAKFVVLVVLLMVAVMLVSASTAIPAEAKSLLRGQTAIVRDEYGVPHIYASTPSSLWYGVGYAQGQDRLWQAEVLRRTTTGTLAELFGSSAVGGDVFARSLFGSAERRAAMFESAGSETKMILQSFTAGLNAWIEEAGQSGQLPPEYAAFGLSPRPWTVDDSMAIFMFLMNRFGEFGDDELANAAQLQELIARFGPEEGARVFADTHWLNDPDALTTVPAEGALNPPRRGAAPKAELPPGTAEGLKQFNAALTGWERNLNRLGLTRDKPSSNAILVGPRLSADGRALLLGGPQMGYSVPQINHEMGLHQGNLQITGMEIAGVPWIPIGVTEEFAWSLTSGISDNVDLYVEVVNPENPSQYLFQGQWRSFECREETIVVRGGPDVTQLLCESIHGPVIATAPGLAFSRKSAVRGLEMRSYAAFLDIARARTPEDISQALSQVAPNLNFNYADTRGNIAYWHFGRIPIRDADDNPWLPHDGTGGDEWQGFVPWSDMPHALNPDQGWMVNWNNKPAPGWDNSVQGFGDWGPVQRVNTLINLLQDAQPGTVTLDTLEVFNQTAGWTTDTPSGNAAAVFVSTLLDDMLAEVDFSADPRLPTIRDLLNTWDWLQIDGNSDGRYDNPSVAIFNTWWSKWVDHVFADDLGGALDPIVVGNLTYRLLADDPALPLLHDYLGPETSGEAMTGSLVDALDALSVQYGSTAMDDWLQPIAVIQWEPMGVGTVPDTIWMNRGTYNQLVHLGKGPELYGENVIAPGQSGDPFSPHFADQLPLYANWTYKPMRLDRQDLRGYTTSITRLVLPRD